MRTKALILIISIGGWLVSASTSYGLKINAIPGIIRKQNRDVQAAAEDVTAAEAQRRAARGKFAPTLDLKSTYTRLNDDIVIDIEKRRIERDILGGRLKVGFDIDPPPFTVQEKNIFNSHLLLTQPLYAGGRLMANYDAALASGHEAKANYNALVAGKILEALERYFQVQLAAQTVEILKHIHTNMEKLQGISRSLVKSGMAANFATLQISVHMAELNAKLTEAKLKQQLALSALQTTLAYAGTHLLDAEDPLKRIPLRLGLDKFKTQSLSMRPEFASIEAKDAALSALKNAETGKLLPTVYAFGKYELLEEELTAMQPLWAVGVGIDIPLTAALTQVHERERVASLQSKLKHLQAKAQSEIPLQVESLFNECSALWESLIALDAGLDLASEALRLAEVRFKSGQGSVVELTKASSDFEGMKINQLLKTEEYNRKLAQLYWASGNIEDYINAYSIP